MHVPSAKGMELQHLNQKHAQHAGQWQKPVPELFGSSWRDSGFKHKMQGTQASRMARELKLLQSDPPHGVACWPKGDSLSELEAQIQGPADTVYEGGVFKLAVNIPARYPFEPPKVRFVTRIYHPNIDGEGRICLDILNMPPKGAWKPSLNINTVLASIGLLLSDPNPDDGLVADITQEFKHQRQVFDAKARQLTQRYAIDNGAGADGVQQEQQQEPAAAPAAQPGSSDNTVAAPVTAAEAAPQQQQQPDEPRQAAVEPTGKACVSERGSMQQQLADENAGANQLAPDGTGAVPVKRPRLALRK